MKKHLKTVISLTVICAVIAVLLGITNYVTEPIIKKQESDNANKALSIVLPDGEDFKSVDISLLELPIAVTEAYSEKNGGYVFKIETTGYSTGLVIMCGINSDGTVAGATCIASQETNGAEVTYGDNFKDKDLQTVDSVDTVAGSTLTTTAYKNAVKYALQAFAILGGAEIDTRSEEEILADSLNKALPQADGKFTPVFITEVLQDVSKVYKADNDAGYVFVSEESFVATDNAGNVISKTDDKLKALIQENAQKVISSTLTEINLADYPNMPTNILKAYTTQSGNFVFELRASGYGINGGDKWHPASGEYIYIKLSATGDGTIISCVTVSQKESENIGDYCAKEIWYSQFNGKSENNYNDVDAISGATITTDGYKKGVGSIFTAIKILKGEA